MSEQRRDVRTVLRDAVTGNERTAEIHAWASGQMFLGPMTRRQDLTNAEATRMADDLESCGYAVMVLRKK